MLFDQLRRRDFITLISGAAARGRSRRARSSRRCPSRYRGLSDGCPERDTVFGSVGRMICQK